MVTRCASIVSASPPGGALRTYFNLFRLPGNRLPFYRPKGEAAGVLQCGGRPGTGYEPVLGKGAHLLEIESADAAGNRAKARCRLLVNADPVIHTPRLLATDGNHCFAEMEIADADDDRVTVSLSLMEGGKARAGRAEGSPGGARALFLRARGRRSGGGLGAGGKRSGRGPRRRDPDRGTGGLGAADRGSGPGPRGVLHCGLDQRRPSVRGSGSRPGDEGSRGFSRAGAGSPLGPPNAAG